MTEATPEWLKTSPIALEVWAAGKAILATWPKPEWMERPRVTQHESPHEGPNA